MELKYVYWIIGILVAFGLGYYIIKKYFPESSFNLSNRISD